jgi:hypothetical protein
MLEKLTEKFVSIQKSKFQLKICIIWRAFIEDKQVNLRTENSFVAF